MKRRLWLAVTPVAVFAAFGMAAAVGVRVNATASMPVGLYHVGRTETVPRGSLVEVCVPPWPNVMTQRGDCPFDTMPLLKPVAAVEGDTVQIGPAGVAVNGRWVARPVPPEESFVAPVPRMPDGTYRVRIGEVWLLTDHHERSFDSRYFGPVSLDWIRGSATPLLVVSR